MLLHYLSFVTHLPHKRTSDGYSIYKVLKGLIEIKR